MEINNLLFFFVLLGFATALNSPRITNITTTQSKNIGENVTFFCSVSHMTDSTHIIWKKGGRGIAMDKTPFGEGARLSARITRGPPTTIFYLEIVNLILGDNGTYVCGIITETGTQLMERTVDLIMHEVPSINSPTNASLIVKENATVALACYPNGYPTPNVTWQRLDNRTLPTGEIKYRGDVLNISSIRKEHRGIYSCIAENGISPAARRDFQIIVEMKPIITVKQPRPAQALNHTAVLHCRVESYPPSNVTWYKDSSKLVSGAHYNISESTDASGNTNSTLRILVVKSKDYGKYTCNANNKFGVSQAVVELVESKHSGGSTGTIPKCSKLLISFVLLNRMRYMLNH